MSPSKLSRLRPLVAAAIAVAAVCCRDLTGLPSATIANFSDTVTVYPVNNTPPDGPNAIDLSSGAAVRMNSSLTFDLAFSYDSLNRLVLLPIRVVASQLAATHDVGFQGTKTLFDSVSSAPTNGYVYDSVYVVNTPTTLIAVNNSATCSTSIYSTTFYAKLRIDSISADKALHVSIGVDPNCGYRSLTPGITPSS